MKQSMAIQTSLHADIALKIASFLQEREVCVLGSCSWLRRELCGSDFLWASLTRQRWSSLSMFKESNSSFSAQKLGPSLRDGGGFTIIHTRRFRMKLLMS